MVELISTRHVKKARKNHKCSYCSRIISKDEPYRDDLCKDGIDIYHWKSCPKCAFFAHELWDYIDPDWGLDGDGLNDGMTSFLQEFICPNCENWNKDYQVNTQAVDNYKKAFKNICDILTNGVTLSNGITCNYTINDLQGGETFAQRKSINGVPNDISYGIVQDWNYYKEYVINGKTYKPYSNERNVEEYNEFVKALGNEEHCKNINYILYKYAYKNAGFMWDGSSKNASTFNPMHFYVKY